MTASFFSCFISLNTPIFFFKFGFIGKKWFKRRKILTPAFHFKILDQYIEIFDRQSNIFIENLEKYNSSDNVEFYRIATLYALDVICGN